MMSVLDRLNQMGTEKANSQASEFSTLTSEPEHPFIRRFRGVMHELAGGQTTSARLGNISGILSMIADEVADEMNDIMVNSDDSVIETYWSWVSQIIAWIGHGDVELLPDELKPFARRIEGVMEPMEQAAIESAG